ncbi:hypothetical protein [Streptomyces atratus]|uniref:hypothetical protein n=1 Tax=Streptomyces atratus TaxID=1893 RepID=UPI00225BCFDC|nr:hypothetical protein [Streptomyces atratus]MCX5343364.1 hypothetical protein [Streptomyces atratus]
MAAAGHVRESYWEGCGPERIEFVSRFRHLLSIIPNPQQGARARRLKVPLSSLSCYWSGRRVPGVKRLRAMHQVLSGSIAPEEVPVALAELELLRSSAVRRGRDVAAASNVSRWPISPQVDARELASDVPAGAGAAPRQAADRRSATNGAVRQTLGALVAAHAAGDRRSVLGIAWSASKTMTADEISVTVNELHVTGRVDLAEAVLLGGRERTQEDAMRIALALMALGLTTYAEQVMRVALPPESG